MAPVGAPQRSAEVIDPAHGTVSRDDAEARLRVCASLLGRARRKTPAVVGMDQAFEEVRVGLEGFGG